MKQQDHSSSNFFMNFLSRAFSADMQAKCARFCINAIGVLIGDKVQKYAFNL